MVLLLVVLTALAMPYYDVHIHYKSDSGYDVYAVEDIVFPPHSSKEISFGITIAALDEETLRQVPIFLYPRSSISGTPLRLALGVAVIYPGDRSVLTFKFDNVKNYEFTVEKGMRLCQLMARDGKPLKVKFVNQLPPPPLPVAQQLRGTVYAVKAQL